MSPAMFPLCGILFFVALTSASNSIENMLQCQTPKDVNAYFTSKGINDPKSYCSNIIEKFKKECGDKKACEVTLKVIYKVKHLIKEVSNKLDKVPCTTTPDITDKVKKIIDRLTNETGEPDVGTEINPADSCKQVLVDLKKPPGMYWVWVNGKKEHIECKLGDPGTETNPSTCEQILSDPTKPDGTYWIWGADGKAVQGECKRTTYTSCYEALETNNDGYYWIKPAGGTLKKEHCVKGKIGTINNPASSCEEILADESNPSGNTYWILVNGQRVQKVCTRYTSCYEALKTNNDGDYWIKPASGTLKKEHCVKGKIGTINNPASSCKEILADESNPSGNTYWILVNGQIVEKVCTRYTSCYEALKTNNDGEYWIKPVGGTLKKEHCVKGKIGTINNPANSCEEILADTNNPSGMYWILVNGQSVHKMCTRYKSCSEILRDPANKAGTYSISGADGKVVQVECTRERLPASCDEVFRNATLPNGKYSLNKNGQKVEEECIRTGFKITLFKEPDFAGDKLTLYSDAFLLWEYPYPYVGDLVQSFEIHEGKWTVCDDACFGHKKPDPGTNRCYTYDVGRYNKDVLDSINLNNDITCVFKGPQ